jgi:hypothetical protein
MRELAAATVSEDDAVMAGELITSDTVVVRSLGMTGSLPSDGAVVRRETAQPSTCGAIGSANVHPVATRGSRPRALADTRRRDAPIVLQLTTLLARLGPRGAEANARSVLDERRREDWAVEGLVRRLDPAPAVPAIPAAIGPEQPARVA